LYRERAQNSRMAATSPWIVRWASNCANSVRGPCGGASLTGRPSALVQCARTAPANRGGHWQVGAPPTRHWRSYAADPLPTGDEGRPSPNLSAHSRHGSCAASAAAAARRRLVNQVHMKPSWIEAHARGKWQARVGAQPGTGAS
jgi:hypothetical protein